MKNQTLTINTSAESMAVIHTIVIPLALAIMTFFIERHSTLVVPLIYLAVLSAFHIVRHLTSKDVVLRHRTKVFFTFIGYILVFFMGGLIVLTLMVAF